MGFPLHKTMFYSKLILPKQTGHNGDMAQGASIG